jgi:hypothetical protein
MKHLPFLGLVALALLLRLPGLGWFPSPAGDEGNWARYGLAISRGEPAALAPDASFVSMLFAHLIAISVKVFGATFTATRLVNVTGLIAGMTLAYAVLCRLGSRAAGLTVCALFAVHPWTVMYTRTASVPYALALAAMTGGPVLFVAGLIQKAPGMAGAGLVVTSLAIHFSPLAAVALIACAAYSLYPANRWVLRTWPLWTGVVIAVAHGLPVVLGALKVAHAAPNLPGLTGFWQHLGTHLHMMGTALMGEATIRHFTNSAMTPMAAGFLILPLVGFVVVGILAGRGGVLAGFPILYFLTGLVVAPLILAPGREWNLPANHMDRYLFALLPGFALLLAEIVHLGRRFSTVAVIVLFGWLLVCSGRIGVSLFKGGVDHGEGIFDGGSGYRGWLVSDVPVPTLVQIRDAVLAETSNGPGLIVYADRTFIPLAYALDGSPIRAVDVRRTSLPRTNDGIYFFLLWPDEVMSVRNPPTANPRYVGANRVLRERMADFGRVRLVRLLRKRDHTPLLELWRAEEPPPRLRPPVDTDGSTTGGAGPRPDGD